MMKVYEGEIGMIGAGTWTDGGGGGKTVLSVLEVGNHQFKKIVLPDYLRNYLEPGTTTRVGISQGLSRGWITRPFVAAVEVDGKKHKTDQVLFMALAKTALYCIPAFVLFGAITPVLGMAACVGVGFYYINDYLDLKRF